MMACSALLLDGSSLASATWQAGRSTRLRPADSLSATSAVNVPSVRSRRSDQVGKGGLHLFQDLLQNRHAAAPHLSLRASVADSAAAADAAASSDPFAFKHVLLPILDRNPYLHESTRQAIAFTTSIAKRNGADVTIVVIDEDQTETMDAHELRLTNIRWHVVNGGYEEFSLIERLGEGKLPAAVVGEVADDLNLDLVVMSMESIHSKHLDGNLMAEFVPCPVLLLPL